MNFKKLLPALTLLFALAVTFAFKPVQKANFNRPSGNVFSFVGTPNTGDEFDPLQFLDVTGTFNPADDIDCAGDEVLCGIITDLIYTTANAPSSQYVGQPKVDQSPLIDWISAAIIAQQDDPVHGIYLCHGPQ